MPNWTAFASVTIVVLVLLLVLSHLTQSAFSDDSNASSSTDRSSESSFEPETDGSETIADSADERDNGTAGPVEETNEPWAEPNDPRPESVEPRTESAPAETPDPGAMSSGMVLANVALSQGLFAALLIGAAVFTGIPADALGIEFSWGYLETGLLVGAAVGVVLYVANEVGAAAATWFGFDHDEQLRELLAPESATGWLVLLGGVLPIIAVFEELLFRAAMIGALEAGFGVSPWLLAVVSSIAFGVGHGMQGSVGILVTGGLGFVLAAVFILTGSFLVVVVAHYLINAFEFVVHEGVGFEWASVLEADEELPAERRS